MATEKTTTTKYTCDGCSRQLLTVVDGKVFEQRGDAFWVAYDVGKVGGSHYSGERILCSLCIHTVHMILPNTSKGET